MKKRKKAAVLIFLALMAICFIVFVIKNYPSSMKFGIFSSIDDMDALGGNVVDDAVTAEDKNLKGLTPSAEWVKKVSVDGAECIVRAYVFASHDNAVAYYKRASNRTSVNEGANGSASAGGLGRASYVTMNENNVLFITGDNFKDIQKVVNRFIEDVPSSLQPFKHD